MKDNELAEAVGRLACSIEKLADELRNQNGQQAILNRIAQMEGNMAIKLSELKNEVAGLRGQVQKIWGEQQTKYDALVVKYDELLKTLANQELDAEAQAEVDAFKAELKAFDETIPDTTQ